MSFDPAWNNVFKDATVLGLKFVPVYGGALSGVVAAIWPSDNTQTLTLLKAYVDQMMKEVLDETKVENLHTAIDGLKYNMQDVVHAESPDKRQSAMQFLLNKTSNLQSLFFPDDDDQPWATMTYLVAFGTIRLNLLRQEWQHYEDIWGDPDSNPAQTLANLNAQIKKFTALVKTGRDYAIKWRQGCIALTEGRADDGSTIWTLTDTQDPTATMIWGAEYGGPGHPAAIIGQQNQIFDVTSVVDGFGGKLDQLVAASQVWEYYSITTEFSTESLGPHYWHNRFGGAQVLPFTANGNRIDPPYTSWDDEQMYLTHGPISRFSIYFSTENYGQVLGLEVWYGGVSSGLHGAATGTHQDITFGAGEWIQLMGFHQWDYYPQSFWVNTNLRILSNTPYIGSQGTSDTVYGFPAYNPLGPADGRLAWLSGYSSAARIGQLRPAWVDNVWSKSSS